MGDVDHQPVDGRPVGTATAAGLCQRCRGPLSGARSVLLLDTGDPGSAVHELAVCEHCLGSYRRWAARRDRHPDRSAAPPKAAESPKPPKPGSPRKRGRGRREPATATEARVRDAARMRVRLIVLSAASALVFYALVSLIAYLAFSRP